MNIKKNTNQKLTAAKKLTLNDLISKKLQREKDIITVKEIEIESLEGALVFIKPDNEVVLDTMDKLDNDLAGTREVVAAYKYLIYQSCQLLHDQELHDAYEVTDPLDIVDKLFKISEILSVGNDLMVMAGFKDLEKQIKN